MMRLVAVAFGFLLLLSACGYHFGGQGDELPGGVRNIHVELFDNRTTEAFIENTVTNHIIMKLATTGKVSIVEDRAEADAVLSGIISGYGHGTSAYDPDDSAAEKRSRIICKAELRRLKDNKVLWRGSASWNEEYVYSSDHESQEALTQEAVAERLAAELYTRLTENF